MSEELQYDAALSKRAFQRGMWMAIGIAALPIVFLGLGLVVSGYETSDIDINVRVVLLLAWLFYIFVADKIANFRLWMRLPLLKAANASEIITLLGFSALMSTMKINPMMARSEMLTSWLLNLALFLALFGAPYAIFKLVDNACRRARRRARLARQEQQDAQAREASTKARFSKLLRRGSARRS